MRSRRALLFAFLVALFGVGSCDRSDDEGGLRFGLLVATTGPSAERGLVQRNAAALAAEEINARGGVLGRRIRLVHGDDGSDVRRVPGLIEGILGGLEAPFVFGPVETTAADAASEAIGDRAILLTASTTAGVGGAASPRCLCASDADQGAALAEVVFARGATSAAILCPETPAGRVLSDAFHARFLALGGTVPLYNRYRPDRSDFVSVVRPVGMSGADAILIDGTLPDVAQILDLYLALYPGDGSLFAFADEVESDAFVTAVGAGRFGFDHVGIGPSSQAAAYAEFEAAYETRYGELPAHGAHGASAYDAVYLAALAIESTGVLEVATLRGAIDQVARGGLRVGPGDYDAARLAASSGIDIDYAGASGEVDLPTPGPFEAPLFETWEVRSGLVEITGTAP